MVKEISGKELLTLIGEGKTVVCDFWAVWCGPCRMLAPVMEKVSEEFEGRAEFVKVNVDENPEVAEKYSVMSIPYVAVFERGALKTQSVGYVPEQDLRAFFQESI